MRQNHEHPLYHLDAETLLVATYIWVDDELKTLGVSKRLCTGGIPLLKHLLQRLPRLREPLEPQDVRFAKQLASPTQDTG